MGFWDSIQHVQIENLRARQRNGEWSLDGFVTTNRRDAEIYERIGRLHLVTEAMWEILSERYGFTVDQLAERVREIDARDAAAITSRDAIHVPEFRCPSCRAMIPAGKQKCQFCGTDSPEAQQSPFSM